MATKKTRQARKGRATGAGARQGGPQRDDAGEDRIIDATLELAVAKGWRNLTLAEVAVESGLTLGGLYALFPSKGAILDAFVRRIDRATLAVGASAEDGDASVRDRLFEIFMHRFDALAPYKQAVASIAADLPRDPLAMLCQGGRSLRSVAWMAAASGVETGGLAGAIRVKALTVIYLYVLRVWLGDEGTDHAKTMAALDTALKRAEMMAQSVPPLRRRAQRSD